MPAHHALKAVEDVVWCCLTIECWEGRDDALWHNCHHHRCSQKKGDLATHVSSTRHQERTDANILNNINCSRHPVHCYCVVACKESHAVSPLLLSLTPTKVDEFLCAMVIVRFLVFSFILPARLNVVFVPTFWLGWLLLFQNRANSAAP